MAKSAYIGVSSKAKKVKKMYIGVGGVAKKVKKAYIGDANGKARLCYSGGYEYNKGFVFVGSYGDQIRVGDIDECLNPNGTSYSTVSKPAGFDASGSVFFWLNEYLYHMYLSYNRSTNKATLYLSRVPDSGGTWTVLANAVNISELAGHMPYGGSSTRYRLVPCYDYTTDTVCVYTDTQYVNQTSWQRTWAFKFLGDGSYSIAYAELFQSAHCPISFIDDDGYAYGKYGSGSAFRVPANLSGSGTYIAYIEYGEFVAQPANVNSYGHKFVAAISISPARTGTKDTIKYTSQKGLSWSTNSYPFYPFWKYKEYLYYTPDRTSDIYRSALNRIVASQRDSGGSAEYVSSAGQIVAISEEAIYTRYCPYSSGSQQIAKKSTDGQTFTQIGTSYFNDIIKVILNGPNGSCYW